MTHSDENRALPLQGQLGLAGTQRDLFEHDDAPDAVEVQAVDEFGDMHDGNGPDTLFSLGDLSEVRQVPLRGDPRSPAARLLESPAAKDLVRRDAAIPGRGDGHRGPTVLEVHVGLNEAGHVLLIAATIEREFRRCERSAREVLRSGRDPQAATDDFLQALSDAPHPWGIKKDGLQLVESKMAEGRLSLVMREPDEPYVAVGCWPRFTMAFATAAIADTSFTVSDNYGWELGIALPPARLKAIAGGVPHGAVEVRLAGAGLALTAMT